MDNREELYTKVWREIEKYYHTGYCVSERGLQAALYAELSQKLKGAHVIVEPPWEVGSCRCTPDLVIVEDKHITDIFELKFVLDHYAHLKGDIRKLLKYGAGEGCKYPVSLNPKHGKWEVKI